MYRELTNLLPQNRSRAFRRQYFLHLATVSILMLSFLILAHGLLLLPTYLSLDGQLTAQKQELAKLNSNLQGSQERDVSARLAALSTDATYLSKLTTSATASNAIRAILAVPHQGITLSNISFTPPAGSTPGHMLLTGKADTRDSLRQYDLALTALPFVSNVNLPISDYADATAISFTITLTGSFSP